MLGIRVPIQTSGFLVVVALLGGISSNPSLESPLMFDSLCDSNPAVVFNKVDDDDLPCVCFSDGVYEIYDAQADCNTQLSLTYVLVPEEGGCVHIRTNTRSIQRVSSTFVKSQTILVTDRYRECAIANKKVIRRKRAISDVNITDESNEDFFSAGREGGHPLLRSHIKRYLESKMTKLAGFEREGGGGTSQAIYNYPVVRLLKRAVQIFKDLYFQKTCQPEIVNPEFLDMAFHVFVNLQFETLNLKEPYIGYGAYKRIDLGLKECLDSDLLTPIVFNYEPQYDTPSEKIEDEFLGEGVKCDYRTTKVATDMSDGYDRYRRKEYRRDHIWKTPVFENIVNSAINGTVNAIAEPLIETVWKMFVHTHLTCYLDFPVKNDFHNFAITILPMFANQIQEIWLKGYDGNETTKADIKLYGGLLGNIHPLMRAIDECVKHALGFTSTDLILSRPALDKSNVWRRKKRDVDDMEDYNEDWEVVSVNQVKSEEMVDYTCKSSVQPRDLCENRKVDMDSRRGNVLM